MKVMFPGTFSPFHNGHFALVEQCFALGWNVVVGIGQNESKPERMFDAEQMAQAIQKAIGDKGSVVAYTGFTADKAKELGCDALVRGIRSKDDFAGEWDLMSWNLQNKGMRTIWLPSPSFDEMALSSTGIRKVFTSLLREIEVGFPKFDEIRTPKFELLWKSVPTPVFEIMERRIKAKCEDAGK